MTHEEAMGFISSYYRNKNPTEEDFFLYEEAQLFLIKTYHEPRDMHNLAFTYLERRRFDLEYKYLEMAAEYGYYPAIEELGYIWYYGQNGTVDYEKAYEYFSRGTNCPDDIVSICCEYKLADMYRYGFYVQKNEDRYRKIIVHLYDKMTHPERIRSMYGPEYSYSSEVTYRLAEIKIDDGKIDDALALLKEAKDNLAEGMLENAAWWGNIEVMNDIVTLMHKIEQGTYRKLDIYDLYWICKQICRVVFLYKNRRFIINVMADDENCIEFENKWYRNARDFFEKAEIDGNKIVCIYDELYDLEVEYG